MKTRSLHLLKKLTALIAASVTVLIPGSLTAAVSVTTTNGLGADTFLVNDSQDGGAAVAHGTENGFAQRVYSGVRMKLLYVRFNKPTNLINYTDSTIAVNFTSANRTRTCTVYGLNDGDPGEAWDEATTSYSTAPGIVWTASTPLAEFPTIDTNMTTLGTWVWQNVATVQTSTPAALNLSSFLEADTDGLVTLLFVTTSDSSQQYYGSCKEAANGLEPVLNMPNAVVDPGLPNLTWRVGNGVWDINTTANWYDGTGNAVYQEVTGIGSRVRLDDTATGTSPVTLTLDTTVIPRSVTNDSTKNYTITGTGAISGGTGIIKNGSGTLTLNTVNDFVGTVQLNAGTLALGLAGQGLGSTTSALNMNGGTLLWSAGSTEDISSHIVNFNAEATLDTGANSVLLANPIGNGGPGGLTKTGSGVLTLSGDNNYLGDTVVAQGTLFLDSLFSAGISNSPVITVNSGATLDAGDYELYLNGANNQKLAGVGTVFTGFGFGAFITPGSSVSPATNGVIGTLSFDGDTTLEGGTLEMDVSQASNDQIDMVFGTLFINSGTIAINVVGTPLANGTYTLITGPTSGSIGSLSLTGFAQGGQVAFLSDATPGQIDLVVAPLSNDNLVWGGVTSAWDVGSSLSWLDGGLPSVFEHGDSVTFNSVGASIPAVSLNELVFPGAVTVNATTDYSIDDGGGRVAGTNALTKSGSGTLTINTPNVNTGGTTINAGTVTVGAGGNLGSGAIVNNGSLILEQTVDRTSGGVSGSGSVTRNGAGTVTLSGGATHTGSTTITAGTLEIGNGGAIGAIASSSIANDGVLAVNTSSDLGLTAPLTGVGGLTKRGSGTLDLGGSVVISGETRVDAAGGTLVAGAANQAQGELWVQANGTYDMNGFDQSTAGLRSTSFAGGVVTNSAATTNTLTITVDNGGNFEDWSGGLNGPIQLVKLGPDEFMIRANGNMTGGAILGEGAMQIRDADHGLGEGLITMSNATSFQFDDFPVNDLLVVDGASATFKGRSLGAAWGGLVSGNTATLIIDGPCSMNASATYQFGNFNGTVIVETNAEVRFSNTGLQYNGGANTTFEVRGQLHTRNATFGTGIELGALTGDGFVTDFQSGSSPGTARYVIGAKGINATFSGAFTDDPANNQFFDVVKVGAATQTLGGSNNWSGSTTVSNGVLVISGSGGLQNNSGIIVASPGSLDVTALGGLALAQTLSGDGTVTGDVTVSGTNEVTIAPGFSAGELTISGNLALATNSIVVMELDNSSAPTSDRINATGTITGAGSLTVTNIGPLLSVGQVFTLFNQPVTGFASVAIATNDANGSYVFDNKLATDGTIEVLAVTGNVDPTPTNITYSVSGGNLMLEWPLSHTGWTLENQTNDLSVGLSTNWVSLGYETTNSATFPVDATSPTVFYRLSLQP